MLKGIHYAIHAGILAADEIFAALKAGSTDLSGYEQAVEESVIGQDLYRSRNMKQPFAKGFFLGGAITNAMVVTKGRFPGGRWANQPDAEAPVDGGRKKTAIPSPTASTRSTSSRASTSPATRPATTRPNHIRVQKRVPRALAETWRWMCPAGVYEIPDDAPEEGTST